MKFIPSHQAAPCACRPSCPHVRALLLAAALTLPSAASACSLSVAMEQWPPYVYTDERRQAGGLDLELARAILHEAGCTLQILAELPTARRQRLFLSGEIDLLLAASDTEERRAYARFSLPYRNETVAVFTTRAKLPLYRKLGGVDAIMAQRLPLLAPKVGWYGRDYANGMPALEAAGRLSTFGTFQQGIKMLDAGRADLILGDMAAVRYEARRQGVAIAVLPFIVLRAPVHLMLNTGSTSQEELDAVNGAITRLEQQGVLGAIRGKYGAQ